MKCGGSWRRWFGLLLAAGALGGGDAVAAPEEAKSALDRYIAEAAGEGARSPLPAGSLYASGGLLADASRDLRARQVGDIVTVVVADRASAVSRGVTNAGRKSSAAASVSSLFGSIRPTTALANLAELGGSQQIQGQGETSRETVLTTTISARVTHVLPNGNLVVEGDKEIWINSERQRVSLRGLLRWNDVGAANRVSSDRLAHLEVRVNGKGVVGDAIRRPNFLYRLLLGVLPF